MASVQAARRPARPVKQAVGGDLELIPPEDEAAPPVGTDKKSDEDAVFPTSGDLPR